MKKLESDIEIQISLKNSELFNDHVVESMENENSEKMKMLTEQSRYVHKNIEERGLFVRIDSDYSSDSEDSQCNQSSESESEEEDEEQSKPKVQNAQESQQKRKRNGPVFDVEESENDQEQKEESKPPKRGGRKKEAMEPTPIRTLRSRKR